jgi:hypothetical protein
MHPKENKKPSETIITYLIESKWIDTSQMLYDQPIRHIVKDLVLSRSLKLMSQKLQAKSGENTKHSASSPKTLDTRKHRFIQ